jgi:hypothetical protein
MVVFGSDENINCVESLIPTECESSALRATSLDVPQSIHATELFIKGCELEYIWKDYIS